MTSDQTKTEKHHRSIAPGKTCIEMLKHVRNCKKCSVTVANARTATSRTVSVMLLASKAAEGDTAQKTR